MIISMVLYTTQNLKYAEPNIILSVSAYFAVMPLNIYSFSFSSLYGNISDIIFIAPQRIAREAKTPPRPYNINSSEFKIVCSINIFYTPLILNFKIIPQEEVQPIPEQWQEPCRPLSQRRPAPRHLLKWQA